MAAKQADELGTLTAAGTASGDLTLLYDLSADTIVTLTRAENAKMVAAALTAGTVALSALSGAGDILTHNSAEYDAAGAAASSVSTHAAVTTSVHGIADTSALLNTANIGSTVQAYDVQLAGLAALAGGANKVPYFTGASAMDMVDLSNNPALPSNDTTINTSLAVKTYVDTAVGAVAGGIAVSLADAYGDTLVAAGDNSWAKLSLGPIYSVKGHVTGGTVAYWYPRQFPQVVNPQAGTSYTLVLGDAGAEIQCNNASPFTLTIPANASVLFPVGTDIDIYNMGAGQVTVNITSDTLNPPRKQSAVLVGQFSKATLHKETTTTWTITGDLVTKVLTIASIQVTDPNGSALATGDGQAYFRVPAALNGYDLVSVAAHVTTVSSSGLPTVQIANVTDTVDMLSTKLSIDASEKDSSTAATAAVIDTAHDDLSTGDELRVDVDVAGSGAKGLIVELGFQ